jgi:diamine N-acetyltransferase
MDGDTPRRPVALRPITESNRAELEALRVSPRQERFVSSVVDSLTEAAQYPDARPITWGVYEGETPVGFVMIADEVGSPDYIPQYLWKLLVDERYQGRGYGTATLDLIVAYFRSRPGVTVMWTSAGEGEGGPIPFYERYGFVRTGEVHDDEVMLRLDLA